MSATTISSVLHDMAVHTDVSPDWTPVAQRIRDEATEPGRPASPWY